MWLWLTLVISKGVYCWLSVVNLWFWLTYNGLFWHIIATFIHCTFVSVFETFFTLMRVKTEPTLDPWHIVKDGEILPRADSSSVRLDRNVSHTIRFNVPEK